MTLEEKTQKVKAFLHSSQWDKVHYPNEDDWKEDFWKKNFLIRLGRFGSAFAVNADNLQEALDYVIDYCEEHLPGFLFDDEELNQMDEDELEEVATEYICGGNHGRYLNTHNVGVEEL